MTINPIKGGFGDDNLTGTSGNDIFWMGAALNAGDKLDGGDQVDLNGDYSAGLVLAADTITDIEKIFLASGHSYNHERHGRLPGGSGPCDRRHGVYGHAGRWRFLLTDSRPSPFDPPTLSASAGE